VGSEHPTVTTHRDGTSNIVVAMLARERGITGVHTHVRQFLSYLRDPGDRATRRALVVTPRAWSRRPWQNMAVLAFFSPARLLERMYGPAHVRWYRWTHELVLRSALRRVLASEPNAVVYAQCPVSARAALRARRGPEQPVVMAVHFRISQSDEWADKGHLRRDGKTFKDIRRLEKEVVGEVDGLVFVSAWARSALLDWLPEADQRPSQVITNFVRRPPLSTTVEPRGDLVSVGNLEAIKNHRFLLEVVAEAAKRGHSYTVDIFGEGVERAALQRLAEELGISGQVRLRGFRPDVEDWLPGYRAYVHASYSESSSLAIMEAMAAGLPIVTSCVKALAELIDDPAEGRYWPIDDVGRATDLLVGLVEDESERRRAGAAARARFERDYDATVVAPRLLRLLDESRSTAAGPVSRSEPGVQERAGCGGVQSQLRSTFNQHRSGHGR
jgi:glycosyltransferase involved in cell wall biosynthesis